MNLVYAQDIAWRYGYFYTDRGNDPMKRLMSIVTEEHATKNTTWLKLDIDIVHNDLQDLLDSAELYKFVNRDDSNSGRLCNSMSIDQITDPFNKP